MNRELKHCGKGLADKIFLCS